MTGSVDLEKIQRDARASLESSIEFKMTAVRELAAAHQRRLDAQAVLDEAEAQASSAWSSAVTRGWSATELRRFGLEEPGKTAPARRARKRAAGPRVLPSTGIGAAQPVADGEDTDQAGALVG